MTGHFCKIFKESVLNILLSGIFICLESSILSCFRLNVFYAVNAENGCNLDVKCLKIRFNIS